MPLLDGVDGKTTLSLQAFVLGFRFDTVISGYLLALPLVLLVFADILNRHPLILFRTIRIFLVIVFILAFFICSADIPFFKQYNTRLNSSALNWVSTPGIVIKMIAEEKAFYIYFILFICFLVAFLFLFRKINRRYLQEYKSLSANRRRPVSPLKTLSFCLPAIFILMLGIRGRTTLKSPIRVGTAYFCNNRFLNQLGLNPVFTFLRSYLDDNKKTNKTLHLADDAVAIANVQRYLQTTINADTTVSPIARKVVTKGEPLKKNVVLVLMESMTAGHLARFGGAGHLTPTLDSLAAGGYSFDNTYSAGIHTFNGLYSTLFSFPALLNKNSMNNAVMPEYSGFPKVMKQSGYYNLFATTHDEQFDNIGGFMLANNFDKVISQKDYPASKIATTFGVPDHYMFDFVMPELNKLYQSNKPFFATLLTTSNHRPFYIPKDIPFTPKHSDKESGSVEYADWAIHHFLEEAAKQPWYNNTVFVFVADHGAIISRDKYDMPLFYHHIPFIVYAPSLFSPGAFPQPVGQIDVFPTVMGLMNIPYVNNTLGVDVLKQQRSYIYFSADDKIGVIDSNYFYTWYTDGREALYDYRANDQQNIAAGKKAATDSMKNYAFNSIQAAQWLILHQKTTIPAKLK
jgi:phosphoglycerol transferase MdoB-like AlkP superfamily enzyme